MPLYEFSCSTCGEVFERTLPLNNHGGKVRCPAGHRTTKRIYSAPAVIYKGSGFYTTDHVSHANGESGKT